MADRFDEMARNALKDARDEHDMYDRCASALRDTHNAAERETLLGVQMYPDIPPMLREHIELRLAELKKGT